MNATILLQALTVGATDTVAKAANAATQAVTQPTESTLSIWDLTVKGGVIMIPLAIMMIIATYIFFERYFAISKAAKEDKNFMNNIKDFIYSGKIDAAKAMCKSADTPTARMIDKGISRIGKPLNDINTAIENVGRVEIAKLEKNISFLQTTSGAAPMIGFLGTVIGMVEAFYRMSMAGNNIDIQILSGGIYTAMITTVGGLVVAIPAYICYNVLVGRIEKVVSQLETTTTEFIDMLQEPA